MKRSLALLLALVMLLALCACGAETAQPATVQEPGGAAAQTAEEETEQTPAPPSPAVADASQMTTVDEVVEEGMVPVYAESLLPGEYPVEVSSSSSMFRIEKALLHVGDDGMSLTMTMSGKSYLYVWLGTALEAATGEEKRRIAYEEDADGAYTFTLPVEVLDAPFLCAAYSKNKELWYDRTLLVRADSLPQEAFAEGFFITAESLGLPDGEYTVPVTLSGGSGRAAVETPAHMTVENGICKATLVWSSRNYDYMKLDGEMLPPVQTEGNSTFLIPVSRFDRPIAVIADTVAMSEPHEISYRLTFDSAGIEAVS